MKVEEQKPEPAERTFLVTLTKDELDGLEREGKAFDFYTAEVMGHYKLCRAIRDRVYQ